MHEEHSLTLMIEGILGKLAPEVDATKTHKIEEEGSSSTVGKDDNDYDDESKIDDVPAEHAE